MTIYYETSDDESTNTNNDEDYEEDYDMPPKLERTETIRGPLILAKDSDLYVLIVDNNYIIKSWITDNVVDNRVYNVQKNKIEIIDPTIVEEDRRLLLPNCILQENLYF